MSYLWVAVGQSQDRSRVRELADDSDKNWIATPKGRKRKKPDGTWQYDYSKPGTGKKAAVASKPTPKKAGSKTMKKEAGTGEVEKHRERLKKLVEMPHDEQSGRTDAEAAAEVAKLQKLPTQHLKELVSSLGLHNVKPTRKDMLNRIRLKLTEARRAKESIEV